MTATTLTYEGPPALVGALVQELESREVDVQYDPPLETKDLATALSLVSVILSATGPISEDEAVGAG